MRTFVARENIRHFRDRLETETEPAMRSHLNKLLVEEEDKLGRNSEALRLVERFIATGKARVTRQQGVVASIERDGRDATQAIGVLNALSGTLLIYEEYRRKVLIDLNQSSLLTADLNANAP